MSTESAEAPLRQGATTRHSGATSRRSNAAGADASALECQGTLATLHWHVRPDRTAARELRSAGVPPHTMILVDMNYEKVFRASAMPAPARRKERASTPESAEAVGWSPREITRREIGQIAAEAIRVATGADVAFNHTDSVVRSTLPAGSLDRNAIYQTGGERGHQLVEVELSGREIGNYLQGLEVSDMGQTQWAGFRARVEDAVVTVDLRPREYYRVVMPEAEWDTRFRPVFARVAENPEKWHGIATMERTVTPEPLDLSWTDAVTGLLHEWSENGATIVESLDAVLRQTSLVSGR